MKLKLLDKIGTFGAILAAVSCPACFPLFAVVGSALGLGFLKPYEGVTMYIFQGLVLLSLIGNIISFLNHKKIIPITIGVASPALIFFAFYVSFHPYYIYTGLLGLVIASVLNYIENKRCPKCV